ncbi:MAG: 23S rRNA (guanosine(2251)-2'-O)-methyltransferase RlmB [Candidatus Caccosoma sp.]|nr:23S rRNA (guanosine(2251)-2'-O)-methyltransferase RlmB [Candidatus Caccosoma sp.]
MEYVFGKNTVDSYIDSKSVVEVYILKSFSDEKILSKIKHANIKVSIKDLSFFDKVANGGKHQGIIAVIKEIKSFQLQDILNDANKKESSLIVILDGIEDPHNFGAIIRTCEAFSVDGIIASKHNSCPLNATVAKVSTGAIANVKIAKVANLTQCINELKKSGYWIYAAEAYNSLDYNTLTYASKTALIVGSEGFGISRLVKEQADFNIKIPMSGKVNSLNVSVATGILVSRIKNK